MPETVMERNFRNDVAVIDLKREGLSQIIRVDFRVGSLMVPEGDGGYCYNDDERW